MELVYPGSGGGGILPESEWAADNQWIVASWQDDPAFSNNATPVVALPMAQPGDTAEQDFQLIASGSWDSMYEFIFSQWAAAGYSKIYIRPGWEMNGTWYPWSVNSGNAAAFVAAFQHLADLAHSFTGMNIQVVWNPSVGSDAGIPFSQYYPGNSYVDVIGLDTYGAPNNYDASPQASPSGQNDVELSNLVAFAQQQGKPFALPEVGAGSADTTFPANLAKELSSLGEPVSFIGIWNDISGSQNMEWSGNAAASQAWTNAYAEINSIATSPPVGSDPPCFCRGTHIATPEGEALVETLRAGDLVTTLAGTRRRLRWVGFGRTLVTPRHRDHASVVVVRRDALADGVPHRDLYVTHGHSFYFEGVLIPAAELVNHRSIAWVEDAQVVEYYHLELDSHDVILAEGAAAETYRDDDNSQHFHNAATRPTARPLPSCAPVLHDHPTVKRIWRQLNERTGGPGLALTENPDLHLLADGERLEAETVAGRVWRFRLRRPVSDLHIVSRSAVPAMVGTEPDQRRLGVALRRIVLAEPEATQTLEWDDARLSAGFHDAEPLDRHRWTDGEAALPLALLAGLRAGALVELHVGGLLPYPTDAPSRHLPEASPLCAEREAVVVGEREVAGARAERMRRRGYGEAYDPALRCLADDGTELAPQRSGEWIRLALPEGARRLRLASRQARPVESGLAGGDLRRLGVAVAALRLDEVPVPLDDPRLLAGWHGPEPGFRWTDGTAVLDVTGAGAVELRLAAIRLPYVVPAAVPQGRHWRAAG